MTSFDPRTAFAGFYTNPTIVSLAHHARWTISGQLSETDGHKAPIDVRHLLMGCSSWCQHAGPVRGARHTDEQCLLTLDELSVQVPMATNAAFFLQAHIDQVMVIDIEPTCPPKVRNALLALPGILYAERSMSGHGHHLVTRLPGNLLEFPIAAQKRVLQHHDKWYEVLFEHWITFTRSDQPLPGAPTTNDRASQDVGPFPETDFVTIDDLYAHLASKATVNHSVNSAGLSTDVDLDEIDGAPELIAEAIARASQRMKTIEDFNHDTSRWEFSILGSLYFAFAPLVANRATLDGDSLNDGQLAVLLAQAARQVLPHRDKHESTRNGRPFLLERSAAMVTGQRAKAALRRQEEQR